MQFGLNPQTSATTGMGGNRFGQAERVRAGAASGLGLKRAQLRRERFEYERMFQENKRQFDEAQAMQEKQFNKQMRHEKRLAEYGKKQDAKAEKAARIGTTVEITKMGFGLANEYNIDVKENLGLGGEGEGGGVDAPAAKAVDAKGAGRETGKPDAPAAEGGAGSGDGQSFWQKQGGNIMTGAAGGLLGGAAGANLSQAVFGEGKLQSTAGGAIGGALSGWAASGSGWGGLSGGLVGGILGYLLG